MAKKDLIGGTLWDKYSHKVAERMNNPLHFGVITEEEAASLNTKLIVADWGAESCGDAVRLYWAVDESTDTIKLAKFETFGCGTAIASSDIMCDLSIGKTVDEALKITNIDVEAALRDSPDAPAIPPQKMHCSVLAYDVIKQAASLYKGIDRAALEEEEIVCECARVSLKTLKDVIRLNDLKTVDEITHYTKAGGFCKSCIKPGGHETRKYYLVDILNQVRGEMEREPGKAVPFDKLSPFKKMKEIELFFDSEIRPALHQDGGDLDIVNIEEREGEITVTISYQGACKGCASATTGTLAFIRQQITENLDSSIHIVAQ